MHIVADQNIPLVKQAFAQFGEVTVVGGRQLNETHLKGADVLLVRSVTRVDAALLRNSPVKFVGSATTGIDHVDTAYLGANRIGFAHAPGSNAGSVAEYVLSAMLVLSQRQGFNLENKKVGIIGYGHIGSRLADILEKLGIECLVNDPLLSGGRQGRDFVSLDDILQADIITLHVPLTKDCRHSTYHMVNRDFLQALKPGAILINTARGAVIDNAALLEVLQQGRLTAVLDVWEHEPAITQQLVDKVELATPHIAGYGVESKLNATQQIYTAMCEYFGEPAVWRYHLGPPDHPEINVMPQLAGWDVLLAVVKHAYDISHDDQYFRKLLAENPGRVAEYFDFMRGNYYARRAFSAYRCQHNVERKRIESLGFNVDSI